MGAGVAKAIADRWPGALAADRKTKIGDRDKLGTYTSYLDEELEIKIINAYTQYDFAMNYGECVFDYDALEKVLARFSYMEAMNYQMSYMAGDSHKTYRYLMPMIGAGLAGGDWNRIEKILNDSNLDITVVIYRN
jgi:O-acetyl-ADP-ribose deacetylase (regulator of RNase III)